MTADSGAMALQASLPMAPASAPSPTLQTTLTIAVAIVEDEPEVRLRFEDAVRAHPRLSWQFSASNVAEAIALTAQRPANVYLVDLGLPDRDGRDFIRWLVQQQPDALPMVVTVFGDDEHVLTSLEAGAMGYLLKDSPGSEIALRIVELHEGGSPISPSVARSVIRRFVEAPPGVPAIEDNPLSQRELEVLRLIEKGMTYDEVAQLLELSWHTVTAYLRRVYRKLQVHSRGEAVFEARQRGIL